MNTKYLLTSMAVMASLSLASCVDMETEPQGGTVSSEQKAQVVENDPAKAAAAVTGIFKPFYDYTPNYTYYGTRRHNDFGYASALLFMETDGQDLVCANNGYNWFSYGLDYSSRSIGGNAAYMTWSNCYSMIYNSNAVIAMIDSATENAESQFNLAQGLAVRAFSYWTLVQLYQFNYTVIDPKTAPAVPVITEKNASAAAAEGIARNTVYDVYEQIFADLNLAIDLLTKSEAQKYERADKRYVDLATAYGLRARANLSKGDKTAAAKDAQTAIDLKTATPKTIAQAKGPGFNDRAESDWMWGILTEETDDVVSSGLINFPSHMGTMNYGYANGYNGGYRISKKLFETLSETDVRRTWFLDENAENSALSAALFNELKNGGNDVPFMNVKFAPYKMEPNTTTNANDLPLMRIEEMYLIVAEGEASAAKLQDFVSKYRDEKYTCNLSGEALLNEIWRQRRIEFWGEGMSWFDVMRLNKGIDRRNCAYPDVASVVSIPAGSEILLWVIPKAEIEANKLISTEDNNPAQYETYETYSVKDNETSTIF